MVVVCHTNLDLKGEKWPTYLDFLPRVGDRIESATLHEHQGKFRLELEVTSVTWRCSKYTNCNSELLNINPIKKDRWIPHIELHMNSWQKQLTSPDDEWGKNPGSIKAFYHWYAPLVGASVSYFI